MVKLEQLNESQRKAVMHGEGPLLVLAGPGSGKTFTITQRILYLIEFLKIPPEEILVITFTKEAALSMQNRFLQQSDNTYPVNFGTFHSVFFHILNQSNGLGSTQILRESQKKNLIYPIIKKYHNIIHNTSKDIPIELDSKSDSESENKAYSGNPYEILSEEVGLLLSAISFYKNTGNMEDSILKIPQEWQRVFEAVYKEYEYLRKKKRAIDFDDMVYECAELLEKDKKVRTYWQNRFSHILIDEMQDINPMQFRVVGMLTKPPYNLFAVGDDDQSIYGFRGSNPACIKSFQKDYKAEQVLLNINYRSHEDIIKASLLVIDENKERFSKQLISYEAYQPHTASEHILSEVSMDSMAGECILPDIPINDRKVRIRTFPEKEEQYHYLIQQLSEIKQGENGAVLFRTNSYMQSFAARLQREGIQYTMKEKVDSIYENRIIKDIMAYLRLASGENGRELWLQILNKPSRYISREALAGCENRFKNNDETSTKALGIQDLNHISMLENIKAYYHNMPMDSSAFLYADKIRCSITTLEKQLVFLKKATPFLAVQYIRKVIGYEQYLKEAYKGMKNGEKRLEEAMELLDWLTDDARQYATFEEWRQAQIVYTNAIKENGGVRKREFNNTAKHNAQIHLMTVHAAKGLEFEHVWIPDCNEKIFPHGSMPDKEACEEERRIFYVGMTRAKKDLELLGVTGTRERPRLLSRFLNPLWKDYFSTSSEINSPSDAYSLSSTISSNSH